MLKQQRGKPTSSTEPLKPGNQGYVSNRGLVIVFAPLAAALVLGYLLLDKLVDISREEDCALAHRYNCSAVELPR